MSEHLADLVSPKMNTFGSMNYSAEKGEATF